MGSWMRGVMGGGHPETDIYVYAFRCMCFKQLANDMCGHRIETYR